MRIVFVGTPDYAVPSLTTLAGLAPKHQVVAVVTQPDRPVGRSRRPVPPPVKKAAMEAGLPSECVLQPCSINEPEVLRTLRSYAPDLLCVVAYGGLLKAAALELARLYPLNAHGSLLPRYRGAAPIQAALLAGDERTGVSIMKMAAGLDSGPVMLQRETHILPTDTAASLHDRLAALAATCFLDALRLIEEGRACFAPQQEALATYAPKLSKTSGCLDWRRPASFLERFVRAMTPWPGAWTTISASASEVADKGTRVRIARASAPPPERLAGQDGLADTIASACAGFAPALDRDARESVFLVRCGDGNVLAVHELQVAGRRPMAVAEFLRGAGVRYASGASFGGDDP